MRLSLFLYLVFASYCGAVAQNLQIRYGGDPLSEKDRIWIEFYFGCQKTFYPNRSSKIIIHELTHHLSRQTIKRLPGWLNEGLSKYFENCELGKKGLKHTLGDYERGRIRTMYMLGEVDLKSFIDNTNGDFRKKLLTDESYAYVLSHALVTFGLEVAEKEFMENFIALLNKKMTGVRYSQLIDAVYPGGFMQFERDFTDFCNSD